jgi:hypothetical protein
MNPVELLKDSAYKLKRAVEIAIEQDEAAGMAYLAREGALA